MRYALILFLMLTPLLIAAPLSSANAGVQPSESMESKALERRAHYLYSQLRCPTCDGQSIAGSDAYMARALRALVRERLKEGDSNKDVLDYIRARYGDAVLMRPPVTSYTWFLWALPVLVLLGGLALISRFYKQETAS